MYPQRPAYGSHGLPPRRRRQSLPPIPDPTATVVVLRLPDAPTAFSSAVAPSTAPPGTTGKSVERWPGVRACSTAHADADIRSAVSVVPTLPTLLAVARYGPLAAHNDNCCGLAPRACKPGVRSWQTAPSQTPRPPLSRQAPPVFSHDGLQRFFVQAEVSHQMFQPAVLIFQTSQSLRFAHFHPAVLTLPAIQRGFAHPVRGPNLPPSVPPRALSESQRSALR